jgi:octaprenyl-diphosphate synthase
VTPDAAFREAQATVGDGLRAMDDTLGSVRAEITDLLGSDGGELVTGLGKRLRSTLVLLSAGVGGVLDGNASTAAAVVELIHLATLIHDDSIDDSRLRRGRPTAHVTWDHKVATMLGDLLYSRAFELLTDLRDQRLSREIARATHVMSRGELEEYLLRGGIPEEQTYLRVVWAKTAAFFGACCRVGAILGGASPPQEETLARFGERLGMAFQVTDDILDYTATGDQLGKDIGRDLRDGIVTLPLIAALSRAGDAREPMLAKVQQAREGEPVIDEVVSFVIRHGGIAHARTVASRLGEDARVTLGDLPPSPPVWSLDLVAQYAFQRER